MNEENFTLYKTFKNQSDIKSLLVQLNSFDIQHKIESVNTNLIPYLQSSTGDEEGLFIKKNDISKLEQMLVQVYQNYPFEEHPFFLMDHSELQNIVVSPQEWGIDNVFFAKKIIALKGNEISEEKIQKQQQQEIEKLEEGKDGHVTSYITAFVSPLLFLYFGTSIFGLVSIAISLGIGFNYLLDFKKSSTEKRFSTYNISTRKIGKIIIGWNILIAIGLIITLYMIYGKITY